MQPQRPKSKRMHQRFGGEAATSAVEGNPRIRDTQLRTAAHTGSGHRSGNRIGRRQIELQEYKRLRTHAIRFEKHKVCFNILF